MVATRRHLAAIDPLAAPEEHEVRAADAGVDALTFRHAFRHVAATVAVVTVIADDGRARGMTVTSMCALSVDPATLLVCIDRSTRTHGLLTRATAFGLSILAADQHRIAARLARHGADKWLDAAWVPAAVPGEPPAIRGAVVQMVCSIETAHAASTHDIVIGRVQRVAVAEEAGGPLVYHDGAFDRLAGSRIPLRDALAETD